MSNKHVRLYTTVAVLCLSRGIWGQDADSVKGEVHSSIFLRYQVTLRDLHGIRNAFAVPVGGDGQFEFRHVPYGEYRLTVLNGDDQPVHEELVTVHNRQQPMDVQVTAREEPRPASGSVSVAELLHPPAKKAFKAFMAAQKFDEAGQHEKAAEQLETATRLSPDYAAAWVNLGAQNIFLKRYEEALRDLTRASEISGSTALILSNMTYAQYSLHRYTEGAAAARAALQLDPGCAQAHYLLGSFLVLDRRTRAEGVQHLELAARTMPVARAELERVAHDSVQVVTHP